MKLNVAYLLGSLNIGGMETLILDILRKNHIANFDMICVHRKDGDYKDFFYNMGKNIYKLTPRFIFDIFYILKLRRLFKTEKIDIIHAQQSIDAIYAAVASFGLNIKTIQTIHGYDYNYGKLPSFILKLSLKLVSLNLFVSKSQCNYYSDKYSINSNKTKVVYNGINFDKLDKQYSELDFISEGKKNNRLQICMVGNFVPVREQRSVCKFLKLLDDKKYLFDFYFVGRKVEQNAHLFDDCYEYCKNNNLLDKVHFLGARGDVPAILQQADAFVYSTDHDTFGIAVIEAIAASLPTFVNDWEVMTEVTNNGEFANIYKTKDSNDLYHKFTDFLDDINEYKLKASKNAIKVRSLYSIESHLKQLLLIYNE